MTALTQTQLLAVIDHLTAENTALKQENRELAALADDQMRDKERALFDLDFVRGQIVSLLGQHARTLQGAQR